MESRGLGRIYVVGEAGGPQVLMVEILIDCPVCGEHRIQIFGHHLKMVRDVIMDAIDQHPELTGPEPKITGKSEFTGQMNDPSTS